MAVLKSLLLLCLVLFAGLSSASPDASGDYKFHSEWLFVA